MKKGDQRPSTATIYVDIGHSRAGVAAEQRGRTRAVGTREHAEWLISKFASADIFYCRGK